MVVERKQMHSYSRHRLDAEWKRTVVVYSGKIWLPWRAEKDTGNQLKKSRVIVE